MVGARLTPLCPAGLRSARTPRVRALIKPNRWLYLDLRSTATHPLKGGDWLSYVSRFHLQGGAFSPRMISPREGEMPGKAEGGVLGTTLLHMSLPC